MADPALEKKPESDALIAAGKAAYAAKEYDNAASLFKKAHALGLDNEVYFLLGQTYYKLGLGAASRGEFTWHISGAPADKRGEAEDRVSNWVASEENKGKRLKTALKVALSAGVVYLVFKGSKFTKD
jgi:hypothetical protein